MHPPRILHPIEEETSVTSESLPDLNNTDDQENQVDEPDTDTQSNENNKLENSTEVFVENPTINSCFESFLDNVEQFKMSLEYEYKNDDKFG